MDYFNEAAETVFIMIAMTIFFKKGDDVNIPYSPNYSDAVTCKST